MKEKKVFILRKTYLDNTVRYFAEETPLTWAATPHITGAHQFKTLKAALRVRRRWLVDQYRRALEVGDGRERCPIDVVEIPGEITTAMATALSSLQPEVQ